MYDVIIVGAGPAGVSAAIYLKRFNKNVIVINHNESALHLAHQIENYYGVGKVTGEELFSKGIKQLKELEIPYILEPVLAINFYDNYQVELKNEMLEAKYLILATGKARNRLNVKNYKNYEMHGLSYCAVCDGFFYRDKKIGLIGAGDYMEHELNFLKNMTKDITIFTNGEAYQNKEFKVVTEKLTEIYGEGKLEGVKTANESYPLEGLFVAIGSGSTFEFIKHIGISIDDKNNIIVNENYETNVPNLYAIGDAIGGVMQVAKAVYDGMMVAYKINKKS